MAGALKLDAYSPDTGTLIWWVNGLARIVIPTPVTCGPMVYVASWAPGGDSGLRITLPSWTAALEKWDSNHDGKLSKDEIDAKEVLERFFRMDLDQDGALNQQEWERYAAVFQRAQNAVLAIRPTGQGELTADSLVWTYSHGLPYVTTPVLNHDALWMVKEGGIVTKLDAKTAQVLLQERLPGTGNYFASPVAADGKIYFASEAGVISVIKDNGEWHVISSRNFGEKIYATPVVDHNHLLLRTDQALYCFQGPSH